MFCELILDSMENNIFCENEKSTDRIAKFEYLLKVVAHSKSLDHMLENHVGYFNIILSLELFRTPKMP